MDFYRKRNLFGNLILYLQIPGPRLSVSFVRHLSPVLLIELIPVDDLQMPLPRN